MELKRRFDVRKLLTIVYVAAFLIYLAVGLQPAEAAKYEVSGRLEIPSIDLRSSVTSLKLSDHVLPTPDTIVGSYTQAHNKTLLIGHASTVFFDLNLVTTGERIYYNGKEYVINEIELYRKEDVEMAQILREEERDTVVMMTCAGQSYDNGDASHRLIVTAVAKA